MPHRVVFLMLLTLVSTRPLSAQEKSQGTGAGTSAAQQESFPSGSYRGKVTIGGQVIPYRARLTHVTLARTEGGKEATVCYTEYLRTGVEDPRQRPVTFCFNGGPGSASLWLHLGGLSPRRIALEPDELLPTGWTLVPNEFSLLDQTDLVFLDPVSTGYSRPEKPDEKGEFHGYQHDVEAVAEFIRLWTAQHGRWSSPQYILGESYGGIRGAAVANHLRSAHNYQVEGLIFVSPVIDFQTIRFAESNDLPYILFLPSYAAVAWHHDRVNKEKYPDLPKLLQEAEKFALGAYASALLQGDRLPEKQRRQVLTRMSELTGLSTTYLDQSDLRVPMSRFGKELLRDQGRIIGRFDGRFSSPAWDGSGSTAEFDPSSSFIGGYFTEAIQQYYYDEFEVRSTRRYAASGDVQPWSYAQFEGRFANAADLLRETMTRQPTMRVLFCLGYTDLATPYMGSLHTISHLDLPAELRGNIHTTFYDAGHMMYLRNSEQEKLKRDLTAFYEAGGGTAGE
jgi:carboxypeptidase C (cathepsin A)